MIFNHASRLDATARRENLYDEIDDEGLVEPDRRPPPPSRLLRSRPDRTRRADRILGAPRAPMTLAFSRDAGQTFEVAGNLEEGDGYCLTNNSRDGLNREFSYPVLHKVPTVTSISPTPISGRPSSTSAYRQAGRRTS